MQAVIDAIDALVSWNYLRHWRHIVGVPCDAGDVNRLKARHDAASRYRMIRWHDATPFRTVGGAYSELVGLTLAYSAFDYMRDVVFRIGPRDWRGRREFYGTLDLTPLAEPLETANTYYPKRALQAALSGMVNPFLSAALLDAENPFERIHVGEALRHTFVHGKLSPSGGGFEPNTLQQICQEYRLGLLDVVTRHMMATVHDPIIEMIYGGLSD